MIVISADPGIANFGWSVVRFEKGLKPALLACGVFQTNRDKKRHVSDDMHLRFAALWGELSSVVDEYRPDLAVCENWRPLRANSPSALLAFACGLFDGLCLGRDIPCVWLNPKDWQKEIGVKAGKKETESFVRKNIVHCALLDDWKNKVRHHAADSIGIALAASRLGAFKLIGNLEEARDGIYKGKERRRKASTGNMRA